MIPIIFLLEKAKLQGQKIDAQLPKIGWGKYFTTKGHRVKFLGDGAFLRLDCGGAYTTELFAKIHKNVLEKKDKFSCM